MRNLLRAGFAGPVWPVNPRHDQVAGMPAWPDVAALPEVPDLAVICTPAATVPGLIAALGRKGTRAAIVLTAGLSAARQPTAARCSRRCSTPRGRTCCASSAPTAWACWCRASG